MSYFIGILVLFISIIGGSIYVLEKFRVKPLLALILFFTFIPLIVYVSGLLNIMTLVTYSLYAFGIINFVYMLYKDREILKKFVFDKDIIFVFFLLLFISIFYIKLHPIHYDNFTHWAKIVRSMFVNNSLPNFNDTSIEFKSYQPGTACFIYFVSLALGKTEGVMCVAQTYIFVVFSCSLLLLIRKRYVNNNLLRLLLLIFIVFMGTVCVPFYDLLVDNIISVVMISCCVVAFVFLKNTKKMFWLLVPFSIYLTIIKNSGIIFAGYNCLFLLISAIKFNKKDIRYCVYLGFICLFSLYLWQHHVVYAFGSSALLAKHSLSLANFKTTLVSKGTDGIINFIIIYFNNFLDIANNINQLLMFSVNLLFVFMIIFFQKHRKIILRVFLIADFIYFSYYILLGVMYMLSMDTIGCLELAGFERYLYTGTFVVIAILVGLLFHLSDFSYYKYKIYGLLVIFIICFSGFIFVNKKVNFAVFLGNQNYEDTYLYKLDILSMNLPNNITSSDVIYVYDGDLSESAGYLMYASRYKFNRMYNIIIEEVAEIDHGMFKTNISTIVILRPDEEILDYIEKNKYEKVNDNIYQLVL